MRFWHLIAIVPKWDDESNHFKKHLVLLHVMQHISLKLDQKVGRRMDAAMAEFNYSTKTEFIRDAIRAKLSMLEQEKKQNRAWDSLLFARGRFKGRGKAQTENDWKNLREEAGKEFMAVLDKRFNRQK